MQAELGGGVGRDDIGTQQVSVPTLQCYLPFLHLSWVRLHSGSQEEATHRYLYI